MQEQMYIVIGVTAGLLDNETFIESLSKAELEERINSGYYGASTTFLTEIPDIALDFWPAGTLLIIRASAFVVPRNVEVVTRQTVD